MPATETTWMRFAPETLRERKMRSGMSGVFAVASRTRNAGEQRERDPEQDERALRAPAELGGRVDDRVDEQHERRGDEHRAEHVGAVGEADALVLLEVAHGQHGGGDPDRDVHEEDPVPVDRLGQHAADEQADRAAGGGDEAVDADRLHLLARLREHRDDHPEDDGRGQRAADALDEARRDEDLLALRHAARHRGEREHAEADEEDAAPGDEIAEPPGQQQQAAERDEVGVDDPGEARLREAEVLLDRGQSNVHDRDVEDDHEHADAEHVERDPARAVVGGGGGGGGDGGGGRHGSILSSSGCS